MLNVDHLGCADSVPLSESKNGFLIRDLPDFAVERNMKSVNWICDLGNANVSLSRNDMFSTV